MILRILRLMFAVLVTVGLTVAPLTAPAAARPMPDGAMDMSMSADMPCCPDAHKTKICPDCPLVAMCAFVVAQLVPASGSGLAIRYAIRAEHSVLDDTLVDGLDRPPPDQPPRTLV